MKKDDETKTGEHTIDDLFIGEPTPEVQRKEDYANRRCKKNRHGKFYYECREPTKRYHCLNAISTGGKVYCPK